ncbi:MAG: hypothetical protein K2N95_06845 [Lachnospiraceae bacterium]|nr:hypothetical protein [Lachnospiraceae bacterium]
MKVQELRQLMEAADMEHLMKAFAESYKHLRKEQKEEIDPVIVDILKGNTVVKKKTEEIVVEFEDLEQEIEDFARNAYAQNYVAPNRVIPKNQRPKWRFMVKKFIKELEKIPLEDSNYAKAVKLLTDIYALICDSCIRYMFSTEDPFRSIGWEQAALFELVVRKTFSTDYTREEFSRLLLLAAGSGLSIDTLRISQQIILIDGLKTRAALEPAAEEVQKMIEERAEKLKGLKKYDNRRHGLESDINELCDLFLLLSAALAELDRGVEYYFSHYKRDSEESTLYHALNLIDRMEEDELWIQVYEYGMKHKIKLADYMQTKYEERKKQSS